MDPMQQTPQGNPYEFITNPGQAPKKPLLGGSTKSRVLLVVGGIFLLFIIFGIANALLSSGKNASTQALKNIVAEQEEIIRIADIGTTDALGSEARGYAITVSMTTQTNQQEMLDVLKTTKIKISNPELKAKFSAKTDEAFTAAKANNRYDEALTQALNESLTKYMKNLKSAYNVVSSEKTKTAIDKAYTNADTLLKTTAQAQ